MTRLKRILAGALIFALGFGYGFAVHRHRLFPYAPLRETLRLASALSREWLTSTAASRDGPVGGRSAVTPAEIARLEALGYLQGYDAAPARSGVITYDRAQAFPGLNLYVSGDAPEARLMTMEGEIVHSWRAPFETLCPLDYDPDHLFQRYWRRARLLPNGDLLAIFDLGAVLRIDSRSRVLWSRCGPYHHDLTIAPDDSIYLLSRETRYVPEIDPLNPVLDDVIEILRPDGVTLRRVSILDALSSSDYAAHLQRIERERVEGDGDVFHTNSLEILDGRHEDRLPAARRGNVLISIRQLDLIAIVDMQLERITWAISGISRYQHEPILLANGNLLLFDNLWRSDRSRVVELDPNTQRIVWTWAGGEGGFFSLCCGANQRLPNGNTLVTETGSGRAIELSPAGEVVWKFVSPHRTGENHELVAALFDLVRIEDPRDLAWLPEAAAPHAIRTEAGLP